MIQKELSVRKGREQFSHDWEDLGVRESLI